MEMDEGENALSSQATSPKLNQNRKHCRTEVGSLFKKLSSWREESQREYANIIGSHSISIDECINDLEEEVSDLEERLADTTKERNDLLQRVDDLSGEIRQLSAKLPIEELLQESEEQNSPFSQEVSSPEVGDILKEEAEPEPEKAVVSGPETNDLNLSTEDLPPLHNEVKCESPVVGDSETSESIDDPNSHSDYDGAKCEQNRDSQPSNGVKCQICPKWPTWNNFSDGKKLENHSKIKHGWGVFKCLQCEHKEDFLKTLIEHLQETGHVKDVKCPQCKNTFSMAEVQPHYKMCVSKNSQTTSAVKRCPRCFKNYKVSATLEFHMKMEHSWGIFKCLRCDFAADYIEGLIHHINEFVHCEVDNKLQCPQCKGKFLIGDMNGHYLRCVSKQIIQCPWCSKVFDKNDNYKFELHRKMEHFWGTFTCPLCNLTTQFAKDLIYHIQTKEEKYDGNVACPECKIEFPLLKIQPHYETCVFKNINCPWCSRKFKSNNGFSGALNLHKKMAHFWGLFKCIQCSHRANFAKELIKHMEEEDHMENPYTCCPNCKKEFPMLDVESHYQKCVVDEHTKCKWCDEKISAGGMMNKHKKRVHFWGMFKCPQCQMKFNFANDLIEHMKFEQHLAEPNINCPNCSGKYSTNDIASHYRECVVGEYKMKTCPTCKKRFPKDEVLAHQDSCVAPTVAIKPRKVRALGQIDKKNFENRANKKILVLRLKKPERSAPTQNATVQSSAKVVPRPANTSSKIPTKNKDGIPTYEEYMEHRRRTVPSASNQCCVCPLTFDDFYPKGASRYEVCKIFGFSLTTSSHVRIWN